MRKHLITAVLCMALANTSHAEEVKTRSGNEQTLKTLKPYASRFVGSVMIGNSIHTGGKRA